MLPARVPVRHTRSAMRLLDRLSVATATEGGDLLWEPASVRRDREAERMSGLRIGGRKIVRHPRDFWWIDYALNNHVWIVRRWLYERGLGFMSSSTRSGPH
jgi:hypothetical protein